MIARFDDAAWTVLLDVRQPQAYLALGPAVGLARATGQVPDWLPIAVPALRAPSAPAAGDDRSVRHRRYRAQAVAREVETYARAQSLVVREPYREGGSAPFRSAWLWVRERHPARLDAFLAEGFRRYWSLELDPADEAAVGALVDQVEADAAGCRAWRVDGGVEALSRLEAELAERGLARAPSYVLGEEYFVGRQHLPMIRWILEGRRGLGPI